MLNKSILVAVNVVAVLLLLLLHQ